MLAKGLKLLGRVSRQTWAQRYPQICRDIEESEFVGIDLELSGLHHRQERYVGTEACYSAHREGARAFIPLQLGLCCVKKEGNTLKLVSHSMYVFPTQEDDRVFSASTATIKFLEANGFNFSEWASSGLGWLLPDQEATKKEVLVAKLQEVDALLAGAAQNKEPVNAVLPSPVSDFEPKEAQLVEEVRQKLGEWQRGDTSGPLKIPVDLAFQRLILHSVISREFPHLYSCTVRQGDSRLVVVYANQEGVWREQKKGILQELEDLQQATGIRLLFDKLRDTKKTLVGHNCFYDLVHIYQSFYGELPAALADFKSAWTQLFPLVVDTKYLGETCEILEASQAPGVLQTLCDHMALKTSLQWPLDISQAYGLPPHFDKHVLTPEGSQGSTHDAGYDAFLTALLFIFQAHQIAAHRGLQLGGLSGTHLKDLLPGEVNRIRLVKTNPNVLLLHGHDEADMSRHFWMTGFPDHWKKWEIFQAFSPLWVNISWVNEGACWVMARNDEDVQNIQLLYDSLKAPQFKLITHAQYVEHLKTSRQGAPS